MTLALIGLAGAVALGLLGILLHRASKLLATSLTLPAAGLFLVASTYGLIMRPNVSLVLVWVLSMYQIVNLARLQIDRLQPDHLQKVSIKTLLALTIVQACLLIAWVLLKATYMTDQSLWLVLLGGLLLVSTGIYASIGVRVRQRPLITDKPPSLAGLPTVSVLIPARNETDELEACLESWVRSDYPKLEIIVLDDCSQMSRTPEIIRQFAHAGVRFIPGKPVKRGWLAKNQAYEALAAEATGDLFVFCGVDTRVQTDSLRLLAADFYAQQVQMASVLPHNFLQAGRVSVIQLMRYGRELIRWPRAEQPAVLSTLWLIQAATLQSLGGFSSAKQSVLPEAYFSRVLQANHAYVFWLGDAAHNVASNKHQEEQYETAVRTLYPSFHKQIEAVVLVTVLVSFLAFLPLGLVVVGLFMLDWPMFGVALLIIMANTASYRRLLIIAYGEARPRHTFAWPKAVVAWLQGLNYSMYKYEFSEVEWKGRNICLPVMNRVVKQPRSFKVRNKYRKR